MVHLNQKKICGPSILFLGSFDEKTNLLLFLWLWMVGLDPDF